MRIAYLSGAYVPSRGANSMHVMRMCQAMAKLGEEAEVALRITLQDLVEHALREELRLRTGRPQS